MTKQKKAAINQIKVIISPRDFRINPTFPKIESVDWEKELHESVNEELKILVI